MLAEATYKANKDVTAAVGFARFIWGENDASDLLGQLDSLDPRPDRGAELILGSEVSVTKIKSSLVRLVTAFL